MNPTNNPGPITRKFRLRSTAALLAAVWLAAIPAPALTILSAPVFFPSSVAPLAGTLHLTTDVPVRVSVVVEDGHGGWSRDFLDYSNAPTVLLAGFKPSRNNQISVILHDRWQNTVTNSAPLIFNSPALPADFPGIVLLTNRPELMEPGYTLFRIVNNNSGRAYLTIVDQAAEVVWYSGNIPATLEVKQLADGNLFLPETTSFLEANLLGQTVQSWSVPSDLGVNYHDGTVTDHGTILYINDTSRVVPNFPSSNTNPDAPLETTSLLINRIVELSQTDSTIINNWTLMDMVQPTRIDYLTFSIYNPLLGWDCEHANAVIADPRDDSVIVSMRHQDAVIKFSWSTGKLKWILGPHENWSAEFQPYLLTPVGTPFEWSYAQHAPMITPQGTLLIYDDGNFRASPFLSGLPDAANYSRAVEYRINEETMEVSQVWDYGRTNAPQIYTDRVGNADWLPQTGNVLVTFGNVNFVNGVVPDKVAPAATMARIQEVTHTATPQVVFDLAVFNFANSDPTYLGTFTYRSHRIADLYAHQPKPVSDLQLRYSHGTAILLFSGDSARTYTVESSRDLAEWGALGTAIYNGEGNFSFTQNEGGPESFAYYRVVTN